MYFAAFPDLHMEPEDVLVSGDKAVARAKATGTHQGEFMGMPATGKSVEVELIDIMRFGDDNLVCEHWGRLRRTEDDAAARRHPRSPSSLGHPAYEGAPAGAPSRTRPQYEG
jgi:predicted ester cyclase